MSFTDIDGLRIHYHAVGEPTARRGQRVLYVHGTGCNTRVWNEHMEAIADAHMPVAIDLPGHGQSQGYGCHGAADYGYFVVKLAEALGWDRFVVAGHSMGGAVALTTAIYHADMLNGVVLIATGARLRVHPAILQAARAAAISGTSGVMDRSWAYASSTPPAVVDAVQAIMTDTDPNVIYRDWICDDSFDVMRRVQDIAIPTLAVCGKEDQLTPVKYHRFFQDRLPNCQLAIIEQAGHWVYREQPEAFTHVVKTFLDSLPTLS